MSSTILQSFMVFSRNSFGMAFALGNRPKSLVSKELGSPGGAPPVLSAYAQRTYVRQWEKWLFSKKYIYRQNLRI